VKSRSLPTVDNPWDFQLGGLYALILLLFILLIFFRIVQGLDEIHSYALQKSSAVRVSLETVPALTAAKKSTPTPRPESKPVSAAKSDDQAVIEDISSLFSELQTQKIVQKKRPKPQKKIDSKRIASLQKRIKTTEKRSDSHTAEMMKTLKLVTPVQPSGGGQASGGKEVDAYFGKIQALIYENFFPPVNSQGLVAQIRIRISAAGKLTQFKLLRASGDAAFDHEIALLEQRLRSVSFAKNPDNKEAVLDVRLVSKE